jgi:hypothetical protein
MKVRRRQPKQRERDGWVNRSGLATLLGEAGPAHLNTVSRLVSAPRAFVFGEPPVDGCSTELSSSRSHRLPRVLITQKSISVTTRNLNAPVSFNDM